MIEFRAPVKRSGGCYIRPLMLTLPGTSGQPIQLGDNQHVILFELIQQLDETRPLLNGGTAGHPI